MLTRSSGRPLFIAIALTTAGLLGHAQARPSTGDTRPAITGIAFVRFLETDPSAAAHFFHDTLGFDGATSNRSHVYAINPHQWLATQDTDAPPQSRLAAVGFTTTDAAALLAWLAVRGVPAEQPLLNGQFSVRDPEGNLVTFVQQGSQRWLVALPPSPRAISHRIIHAGFVVHDEARENAFYRGLLGFTPYWRGGATDRSTDYVSQQVPDGTDWLEYMLNTSPAATQQQRGGSNHVSLGVDHMTTVEAQLRANGCQGSACGKPLLGRDGKVQLNLFDPEGSRVEVMEFRPSGPVCCSPYTGRHPAVTEER